MQAEQISQEIQTGKREILVDKVGEALGLSPDQSHELAAYMQDEGWAKLDFTTSGQPTLRLTRKGFNEIAKLHWPRWRQWLDKHGGTIGGTIGGAIAGLCAGLIAELIRRFVLS